MPKNFIQGIAEAITDSLPEGVKNRTADVEQRIKEGLDQALSNFKVAKQEEFDIQQKVLMKTREKLELLEKRVAELEAVLVGGKETEKESEKEAEEQALKELDAEMKAYDKATDSGEVEASLDEEKPQVE